MPACPVRRVQPPNPRCGPYQQGARPARQTSSDGNSYAAASPHRPPGRAAGAGGGVDHTAGAARVRDAAAARGACGGERHARDGLRRLRVALCVPPPPYPCTATPLQGCCPRWPRPHRPPPGANPRPPSRNPVTRPKTQASRATHGVGACGIAAWSQIPTRTHTLRGTQNPSPAQPPGGHVRSVRHRIHPHAQVNRSMGAMDALAHCAEVPAPSRAPGGLRIKSAARWATAAGREA